MIMLCQRFILLIILYIMYIIMYISSNYTMYMLNKDKTMWLAALYCTYSIQHGHCLDDQCHKLYTVTGKSDDIIYAWKMHKAHIAVKCKNLPKVK
jgi:hypothetical protein